MKKHFMIAGLAILLITGSVLLLAAAGPPPVASDMEKLAVKYL